jgi:ABC-type polysaccharide/polyol phosphate export permease
MQGLLLTLSTVYYPIANIQKVIPPFLMVVVNANPLSLASGAMRQYAFQGIPIQPIALAEILAASIPFVVVGAVAYTWALRKVQTEGKL